MVSVMDMALFVLAMRRLLTTLFSLLEESYELLHCLLDEFLGNIRVSDLFVSSLMDH